jgi:hypothetical protein
MAVALALYCACRSCSTVGRRGREGWQAGKWVQSEPSAEHQAAACCWAGQALHCSDPNALPAGAGAGWLAGAPQSGQA